MNAGWRARAFAALGALLLGACAAPGRAPEATVLTASMAARADAARLVECLSWIARVDALVAAHGARDAMHSPVAGQPFLRVDRLHASLAPRLASLDSTAGGATPGEASRFWLERLRQLDAESRRYELMNLPAESRAAIAPRNGSSPHAEVIDCGRSVTAALLADRDAFEALRASASVPDDYSMPMRAAGLYPLTRWPFLYGARRWRAQAQADFALWPLDPLPGARVRRYAVAVADTAPATHAAALPAGVDGLQASLFAQARHSNPLGLPLLSEADTQRLLVRHAPILDIEEQSDADRPGMPVHAPLAGGSSEASARRVTQPSVDASRPVMTARTGLTRVADRTLLQLVYTVWFSERPPRQGLDLLAGRIDALTWRVTLDEQGRPWVYDSIHACGCYHLFFPTERARLRTRSTPSFAEEGLFAPQGQSVTLRGDAVVLRVAAASHYLRRVIGVRRADETVGAQPLALVAEDDLRSLPLADGSRGSFYRSDGLIEGTERGERLLFWPMGIASAGAMRQPGRQATAFVGRRHFDDADLFDRIFEP